MIHVSYDRHHDLRMEVVVFLDDESGDCLQIQHELPAEAAEPVRHQISTGASAPVVGGIFDWRYRDMDDATGEFRFALTAPARRLFGGVEMLTFRAEPLSPDTLEEIRAHLARMLHP